MNDSGLAVIVLSLLKEVSRLRAALQSERQMFLQHVNHDLKAPVTVLNWNLSKLHREGLSAPNAANRLEQLERTSDRLFTLIAEFGRSYDGDVNERTISEVKPAKIDLRIILAEGAQMQQSYAEMRNSSIEIDLPSYPMPLFCQPLQISRVIDNLLRNALAHNPPGTTVEVSARKRASIFQVDIFDNGIGISKEHLDKIFDPGFTTCTNEEGRGLGLSISKTLIERAGGTIAVDSEEDIGTHFILTLPAAAHIELDAFSSNRG